MAPKGEEGPPKERRSSQREEVLPHPKGVHSRRNSQLKHWLIEQMAAPSWSGHKGSGEPSLSRGVDFASAVSHKRHLLCSAGGLRSCSGAICHPPGWSGSREGGADAASGGGLGSRPLGRLVAHNAEAGREDVRGPLPDALRRL